MEETSIYVEIEGAGKNYYGYENWEYMNYDEEKLEEWDEN